MDPNKKTSSKCGDVLHKGSSLLSFISLLLIVPLFLRMESINRKTEMNEMRISKVESRVQTELLQTTDHKNDMEKLESKYKRTIDFSSLYSSLRKTTTLLSLQNTFRQKLLSSSVNYCTRRYKLNL